MLGCDRASIFLIDQHKDELVIHGSLVNSAFNMMNSASKMMGFVLEMVNFVGCGREEHPNSTHNGIRRAECDDRRALAKFIIYHFECRFHLFDYKVDHL